jgi:conjugal transfer pilus assembly protein TraB
MLQRIQQLEEANRSLVAAQRDFNEAVRRGGAVAPPGMDGAAGRRVPVEPPPEPPPAPVKPGAGLNLTGLGPPPPDAAFRPGGVGRKTDSAPAPSMRSVDLTAAPAVVNTPGAAPVARVETARAPQENFIADDPLSLNRAAGRSYETFIPPGTFCRVSTLVGMEAPTGGQAQTNPVPAQFEILDDCTLPNGRKAPLKGCFVTANGYGDLSSERAYIRLDRLSCIDDDDNAVDIAVRGYVVGEDGKPGMSGTIVNKQGTAIANSIYAALASGTGRALRNAGVSQTINPLGAVTETTTDGFKAGLGEGLSKGFDAISAYYLRVAEKLFPTVSVSSMRTVEIAFNRGFVFERRSSTTRE